MTAYVLYYHGGDGCREVDSIHPTLERAKAAVPPVDPPGGWVDWPLDNGRLAWGRLDGAYEIVAFELDWAADG